MKFREEIGSGSKEREKNLFEKKKKNLIYLGSP